jgi:predicted lactoylglutathione lyase
LSESGTPDAAGVPARLTLVTLGVGDVSRARAFYGALGWKESSASSGDIAFFHTGGAVVALYNRTALADDCRVPAGGTGFRGITCAINVESVAAVDAAFLAWQAAGGRIVKEAEHVFWGGYSGYGADLDGHLWEIAYNPGFPVLPDGRVQLPD